MAGNRGAALVVVVLALWLLAAATLGVVAATSTQVRIAAAFRWAVEADYAADAVVQRAIADLRGMPDWTSALNGTTRSGFVDGAPVGVRRLGGTVVDLDLEAALATCGRAPPCDDPTRTAMSETRPWGANNPRWRPFAYGSLQALAGSGGGSASAIYMLAMVADDPAEADGDPDRDEASPGHGAGLIRVRGEAFGPSGSRGRVEVLLSRSLPGGRVRVVSWWRDP